jgi:hypothetical protein
MRIDLFRALLVSLSFALALTIALPAAQAQSGAPLDKHARRVEKHLARYQAGSFLQVDFRDGSQTIGSLGVLSDASFQFTNSDSNKNMTIAYSDVSRVSKGKEYIGEGSGPGHHVRLLVPVIVGAIAAGAAVAIVEALR